MTLAAGIQLRLLPEQLTNGLMPAGEMLTVTGALESGGMAGISMGRVATAVVIG